MRFTNEKITDTEIKQIKKEIVKLQSKEISSVNDKNLGTQYQSLFNLIESRKIG